MALAYDPAGDQGPSGAATRPSHEWRCDGCAETIVSGPPPVGWLVTRVRRGDGSTKIVGVGCSPACLHRHAGRLEEYDHLADEGTGAPGWQSVPRAYRRAVAQIREAQRAAS